MSLGHDSHFGSEQTQGLSLRPPEEAFLPVPPGSEWRGGLGKLRSCVDMSLPGWKGIGTWGQERDRKEHAR